MQFTVSLIANVFNITVEIKFIIKFLPIIGIINSIVIIITIIILLLLPLALLLALLAIFIPQMNLKEWHTDFNTKDIEDPVLNIIIEHEEYPSIKLIQSKYNLIKKLSCNLLLRMMSLKQ